MGIKGKIEGGGGCRLSFVCCLFFGLLLFGVFF